VGQRPWRLDCQWWWTWLAERSAQRSDQTSSAFGLVTISGCVPYAAVNVWRPSFPSCRLACLEQSATSRHVCTVTACFLQSSEDSSLQLQFSLTILSCLRSDTRHYGHISRSYLLTDTSATQTSGLSWLTTKWVCCHCMSRYSGQKILYGLMMHEDFELMMSRHVPADVLSSISDKLDSLKRKVMHLSSFHGSNFPSPLRVSQ